MEGLKAVLSSSCGLATSSSIDFDFDIDESSSSHLEDLGEAEGEGGGGFCGETPCRGGSAASVADHSTPLFDRLLPSVDLVLDLSAIVDTGVVVKLKAPSVSSDSGRFVPLPPSR